MRHLRLFSSTRTLLHFVKRIQQIYKYIVYNLSRHVHRQILYICPNLLWLITDYNVNINVFALLGNHKNNYSHFCSV